MSSPSRDTGRRSSRSFASRIGSIALGFLIAATGVYVWNLFRFHVRAVVPGEVYRSAQPKPAQLERAVRDYGIRTVINLRGRNERADWYKEEQAVCKRLGVEMYDIPLETFDVPPLIEVQQLVLTLDRATKPVLMHCESGVDRSAWAATVARMLNGERLGSAKKEMSLLNGHACFKCPLDDFFDSYRSWLAAKHSQESSATFREWALNAYCPQPYDAIMTLQKRPQPPITPDMPLQYVVRVTNHSDQAWVATPDRKKGIRLGARLLGPYEKNPPDPVEAFRVPHVKAVDLYRDPAASKTIRPGETVEIPVSFRAPQRPGTYFVQFDMVDEFVHWFSDVGRPGAIDQLVVTPR